MIDDVILSTEEKANNAIIWIENLTDFPQIKTGELFNKNGYCCLGVIGALGLADEDDYVELQESVGLLGSMGELKTLHVGPSYLSSFARSKLAGINDSTDADFFEIQDILKSHPENIFEEGVAEIVRAHFTEV